MHDLSANLVLGYHGCGAETAEKLLQGESFRSSENDYDWLGSGIYFWEANPKRAVEFAQEALQRKKQDPATADLVGAVISPGLTLDLLTKAGQEAVRRAHKELQSIAKEAEVDLPKNTPEPLLNYLDCAVLEQLHSVRKRKSLRSVQTVRGVFVEGAPLYETSAFHDRTHIQLAVRDPACIKGVFRVCKEDLS